MTVAVNGNVAFTVRSADGSTHVAFAPFGQLANVDRAHHRSDLE